MNDFFMLKKVSFFFKFSKKFLFDNLSVLDGYKFYEFMNITNVCFNIRIDAVS